jgi:hypothetical protein
MSGSARSPAARVQSVAVAQGSRAADRRQAVTGQLQTFEPRPKFAPKRPLTALEVGIICIQDWGPRGVLATPMWST